MIYADFLPPRGSLRPPRIAVPGRKALAPTPEPNLDEAAQVREQWARDHGCDSFAQAMEIGLALVVRRRETAV